MARLRLLAVGIAALVLFSSVDASPQKKSGADKLYILNCGEGVAGDISRWSPGINAGKSMDFVNNCYLIRHTQGWLLWDTGVPDAVANMPDGQLPVDPRAVHWRRPKTLISQLDQLGVKPVDISFIAISHTHGDHVGNVDMFQHAVLLVQKAEYEWPGPNNAPRFKPEHPVITIEGDHDVFGDGTVRIIATPGHTPGHQSMLVKLPRTGAIILSGDAAHFMSNWQNRRVPSQNTDKDQTRASMQRIADLMEGEGAQFWINHDKAQRDTLKLAPEFYD